VADEPYELYAEGRDLRRLVSIIGEAALSPEDREVLDFAQRFEQEFVGQQMTDRGVFETLDLAWAILSRLPAERLKRIPRHLIEQYYHAKQGA